MVSWGLHSQFLTEPDGLGEGSFQSKSWKELVTFCL